MAEESKIFALSETALGNVMRTLSQPPGDGGGTTTGLEARIAKVEATLDHTRDDIREIKGDLRKLLYGLIGCFLLLGTMLVVGYLKLDDRSTADRRETMSAIQRVQDALDRLKQP